MSRKLGIAERYEFATYSYVYGYRGFFIDRGIKKAIGTETDCFCVDSPDFKESYDRCRMVTSVPIHLLGESKIVSGVNATGFFDRQSE